MTNGLLSNALRLRPEAAARTFTPRTPTVPAGTLSPVGTAAATVPLSAPATAPTGAAGGRPRLREGVNAFQAIGGILSNIAAGAQGRPLPFTADRLDAAAREREANELQRIQTQIEIFETAREVGGALTVDNPVLRQFRETAPGLVSDRFLTDLSQMNEEQQAELQTFFGSASPDTRLMAARRLEAGESLGAIQADAQNLIKAGDAVATTRIQQRLQQLATLLPGVREGVTPQEAIALNERFKDPQTGIGILRPGEEGVILRNPDAFAPFIKAPTEPELRTLARGSRLIRVSPEGEPEVLVRAEDQDQFTRVQRRIREAEAREDDLSVAQRRSLQEDRELLATLRTRTGRTAEDVAAERAAGAERRALTRLGRLSVAIEEATRTPGAFGIPGAVSERVSGLLAQLPGGDRAAQVVSELLTGASPEEVTAVRTDARVLVSQMLEAITQETVRFTDEERRRADATLRQLDITSDFRQIRSALVQTFAIDFEAIERLRKERGEPPRFDLTTKEGGKALGRALALLNFTSKEAKRIGRQLETAQKTRRVLGGEF